MVPGMNADDWNRRYGESDAVWSHEPNRFVAEICSDLKPGLAIDIACGEGRNTRWLASLGWTAVGVDYSSVAIDKAKRFGVDPELAERLDWCCADVITADFWNCGFARGTADLALLCYLQLPIDQFEAALANAVDALAPQGQLLIISHALKNLSEGIGGPQDRAVLLDPDQLRPLLVEHGLTVEQCTHQPRPVETEQGVVDAIDLVAVAHRPGL